MLSFFSLVRGGISGYASEVIASFPAVGRVERLPPPGRFSSSLYGVDNPSSIVNYLVYLFTAVRRGGLRLKFPAPVPGLPIPPFRGLAGPSQDEFHCFLSVRGQRGRKRCVYLSSLALCRNRGPTPEPRSYDRGGPKPRSFVGARPSSRSILAQRP